MSASRDDYKRAHEAYRHAAWEYECAWRRWDAAEIAEQCERFRVIDYRVELHAQRVLRVRAAIAAAFVAVLLLLVLASPAHAVACPPDVLPAACEAQAACVARVYVTRTASTGVAPREAALVARLAAEHACALESWGYAQQRAAAVAVKTSSAACPPCLTATPPTSSESCPGDRPTWIDALSHGGACALCGGGVALGAWATCGGAR